MQSNSTLDRGVHRMCGSQGLENSEPRQTNALSESIKDHQTKNIQGSQVCWVHRDSHPASLDAHEQFRVVSCTSSYARHFEPSLPCAAKEILLCGCSEQSDRDTDAQEERGCSQVPAFSETLADSRHLPPIYLTALLCSRCTCLMMAEGIRERCGERDL